MSQLKIKKSSISSQLFIPSSKSQTHRAILFATLAKGKSIIHRYLDSKDSKAMIEACRNLGAKIHISKECLEVEGIAGKVKGSNDVIDAHNSGIVLRFLSAIAALGTQPIVITGDASIRHQRPMKILLDSLTQLGIQAVSTKEDGFAPVIIKGPLRPGRCDVKDGSDSQNVSSLLIASTFLNGTMEIHVNNPGEKPWIDVTLDWLKMLGVSYENHQYERYVVHGIGDYAGFHYTVPGDWSSAAFPIASALVTQSELTINNIDIQDIQGDKKVIEILQKMGAKFEIDQVAKKVHIRKGPTLEGITIDVNDCIDALPILAVVACYARGETHIFNAHVARQKECDRLACIVSELKKMGACIQETADGLLIKGSELRGCRVNSYEDHRMAMALVVAGLGSSDETTVTDVGCIQKTYPTFVEDLNRIGANIQEVE